MRKYIFVLLIFACVTAFFLNFHKVFTSANPGNEVPLGRAKKSSDSFSSWRGESSFSYSPQSSIHALSSGYNSSSSETVLDTGSPWKPVSPIQSVQDKVDGVIGKFSVPVTRTFIKIDSEFLEKIEVGGIYEIPIPDAADADMHVVSIETKDGLTNVVGHLSGYPESYFIGFSYDKEGHIYGEITTEKSNYSIKTYYDQPVVIKVLPEMEKTQRNDF